MTLILSGTNGLSDVDGDASTPAVRGTDANTGIFFGADTVGVSTGGAEAMRIDSDGRALVGLTSWSGAAKLVVGPDTNGSVGRLAIASNTTGDNPLLELFEGTTRRAFLNYDASGNICNLVAEESGSALAFQTVATERMRIDSSGNVGIGTSSPAQKLDVSGQLKVINGGDGFFINPNASDTRLVTSGTLPLTFRPNDTERMRIDPQGNLLVGKTSSSGDVVGIGLQPTGVIQCARTGSDNNTSTLDVYSTGVSNYRFYVGMAGTVFATNTSISAISDARHKENIRDLDVGLAEIMQLQPRVFDWKEGQGKNTQNDRGFIAQEFEQVFPDLIDEWKDPAPEGEEPYKSVRQDLIPVLVKAIQELKAELDTVKAELATLKG
jgi:hypothetical protein